MNLRPAGVTIIAGFLFVASVIAAVVGTAIFFPTPFTERMWEWNEPGAELFRSVGPVSGVFLWALGIAVFAAALGFLRGRRWAWRFAIALFVIDGSGDVVSYLFTHNAIRTIFGVVVSTAFLIVLMRPRVRGYFEQQI